MEEIQRGKTPNPDILCNSRVKFGAFREWLDTNEDEIGRFDRIASGHYAALERKEDDETDVKLVSLSGDARKDQTYFLAHLSTWQLQKAMFPIGGISKPRIRERWRTYRSLTPIEKILKALLPRKSNFPSSSRTFRNEAGGNSRD